MYTVVNCSALSDEASQPCVTDTLKKISWSENRMG